MNLVEKIRHNYIINLTVKTFTAFFADRGNLLAAGLSYYLLFSLFPFALAVISLAGYFLQDSDFQNQVITAVGNLLPVARNMIIYNLKGVVEARAVTGILALLGLIWSASAFVNALRNALNAAWGVGDSMPLVKSGLVNALLMIGFLLAFMLFIWLSTLVKFIYESNLQADTIRLLQAPAFMKLLFNLLNAALIFTVILLLYRYVPGRSPRWRDIWPGALLATLGIETVRFGFLWYVKNYAQYNLVYGSIGTIIALLAFVYFTAWVLLFCARMSAVNAQLKIPSSAA